MCACVGGVSGCRGVCVCGGGGGWGQVGRRDGDARCVSL